MKKIFLFAIVAIFAVASCKKYNTLGYTPGTGVPTITSVHTLTTSNDTGTVQRVIVTMDSAGQMDTTSYAIMAPPEAFDSVTSAGNLGQYYVIYGTNLGSATQVTFNGAVAYLNRAWNTDNSIIVDIPSNAPFYGSAATDTLTVTTTHGSVSFHFSIIPPAPTVNAVSDYDFWTGSQITLTGVGFINVTSVGLVNSGSKSITPVTTATIVSQNDSVLVLQFPQTTLGRANLVFSYTSVGTPATATASQEFVNLSNATNIVFDNSFQNGWADNSWQTPSGITAGVAHGYGFTSCALGTYPSNGWKIEGWANWYPSLADSGYTYLTFWIRGGTASHTFTLVGDKAPDGYGQVQYASAPTAQQIYVPAGVWTYFKIPIGSGTGQLNFWATGAVSQELGFFLQGASTDPNESIYFDEVAFVK